MIKSSFRSTKRQKTGGRRSQHSANFSKSRKLSPRSNSGSNSPRSLHCCFFNRCVESPSTHISSTHPPIRLKTMSVDEQRDWLAHFARTEITKIFEKAKFNFQVYKMAVKSLQRKQKSKEEYEHYVLG